MARYIDADSLKQRIKDNWYSASEIEDDIDAEPTANVVEKERYIRVRENADILAEALSEYQSEDVDIVVRCKYCKYYLNSIEKCGLIDTRLHFYETGKTWTDDCYCSWGEKENRL